MRAAHPPTADERQTALPQFNWYPTAADRALCAIVSNYDQSQVAAIADDLADDESFRNAWSEAEGLPSE